MLTDHATTPTPTRPAAPGDSDEPGGCAFASVTSRVLAAAADDPARVVLTDERGPVTGAAFVTEVHRLAWILRWMGVRAGQTVGVAAGVTTRAVLLRYAAGLVGCATVFCPEVPGRFDAFVSLVRPDLLIADRRLRSAGPELVGTRVLDSADARLDEGWPSTLGAFADGARPEGLGVLISSGGTTGAARATRRSFAEHLALVDGPADRDRRQLICTPLAYVAQVLLDVTLVAGGQVVLLPGFVPSRVLAAVETHRPTHLGLVEPLLAELTAAAEGRGHDLTSLRSLTHIGATAPAALRRRWLRVWGPVLVNLYGSSEIGLATALLDPEYGPTAHDEVLVSAGAPLPGAAVTIETGCPVTGPGARGRIVVRTRGRASGYLMPGGSTAPPAAGPAEAFRTDGWFASGDLGVLDRQGRLTVLGRAADQREVGGRLLLPVDVETACYADPAIAYAVAVPLDADPACPFGVVVTAAAGSQPSVAETADRLVDELGCSVPVALVAGPFPVTEQGKPDRPAIAALLTGAPGHPASPGSPAVAGGCRTR